MNSKHKQILKKNRLLLARDLVGDEVFQFLVQQEILNDHLIEIINSKPTTFNKNVEFLNVLVKRGPNAFQFFIDGLDLTDQTHLADPLVAAASKIETRKIAAHSPTVIIREPIENSCEHTNTDFLSPTRLSSFSFSSLADDTKRNGSLNVTGSSLKHDQTLSKRQLNANEECIDHHLEHKRPSPSKKQCLELQDHDESTEVIPSPNGILDDLLSTSPNNSLIASSALKDSKLKNSTKLPNCFITKDSAVQRPNNPLNYDLTDGPYLDDLIVRTTSTRIQGYHYHDCYDMSSSLRGLALIISVDHFEPSACLDERQAADVDRARLEFVLRQLGFKCYILVDGTAREIWNVLEKFVSLEDHDQLSVSMLVAMSHGEDGCFFGRDGGRVYIHEVIDLFNNAKCKGLQNKPKILIFQSCRGNLPDSGVDEVDGPHRTTTVSAPEADMESSLNSTNSQNKVPTNSDCLVGYATVKGYAAMRNTKHGSWYIQALVKVLAYHSCDRHLVEMMTIVNNMVKGREGNSPASIFHRCKEMSVFHSTLCKKLYFFPKE